MCGSCGCADDRAPASAVSAGAEATSPAAAASPAARGDGLPQRRTPSRQLLLERRLLARNDAHADANRRRFRQAGLRVVNLLSSPGSGKTALLESLARREGAAATAAGAGGPSRRQAALVGDLATDHDARRLDAAGLPALQINTGRGCHLEAAEVGHALDRLEAEVTPLADLDLLWIENVGNLVCPAGFDLGEDLRVVLLACTEGEDKPLKYAPMFHSADLVLISKADLAEVVGFDRPAALAALARVAPRARVLMVSARSGQGLAELNALLGVAAPPWACSP